MKKFIVLILVLIVIYSTLFGDKAYGEKSYPIRTSESRARVQNQSEPNGSKSADKTYHSASDSASVADYIHEVFQENSRIALAVAKAESGLQCEAMGDSGNSVGLFQINKVHWKKFGYDNLFDCRKNIEAAYEVFQKSGWEAWSVYKNKTYLKFL